MIQTSFFPHLEKDAERGSLFLAQKYPIRYINKETKAVLKEARYIKNGKKVRGAQQFFINNEWVNEESAPERREWRKNKNSSLEGFFQHIKKKMREKEKTHGKFLVGNNDFEDKWNCHDKVKKAFWKQVERYGYRCPITHLEFTTTRNHTPHYDGRRRKEKIILTNLSADRLLNHIHYTQQNVLFTSAGWNLIRGDLNLSSMKLFLNNDHVERYEEILMERFPDYKEENE